MGTLFFRKERPRPELPVWEMVLQFESWRVQPYDFVSLQDLWWANKGQAFDEEVEWFGVVCGDSVPLKIYLLEHGFMDIDLEAVKKFSFRELGVQLQNGEEYDDLLEVVSAGLATDLLGANLACEHRAHHQARRFHGYDEYVQTEEFVDCVAATELKEVARHSSSLQEGKKAYQALRVKVVQGISHCKNHGKVRPKKLFPSPLAYDDAAFDEAYVASHAPVGCRVFKDTFNGRWRFYWRFTGPPEGPWRDVSRSWGRRSCRASAI